MMTSCRCGCGREVASDARRRRAISWVDVTLDGSTRAQHAVAADAVAYLEDVVRRYGCTAAAEELPEWRDRANFADTRTRGVGGRVWTPEARAELVARWKADERRRQLGEVQSRDRARQLDRMGVATETVSYVETTPPRSAAAVAAETALLAADFARIMPPRIRWFARASGKADERVVRRGSPVRGFVDRMERPPTIWLNVDHQGRDDLVEAVVHEVGHLRVGDAGAGEVAVHRFTTEFFTLGPGAFDRRTR